MQRLKGWSDDAGFTGLEGAIILIAFVTIASVFSFVVLSSGFFATDTAQKVIYTGVEQSAGGRKGSRSQWLYSDICDI